jgi:hypothetical protein
MDSNDIPALRTKLRAVNIEHSALLKGGTGEGRFVRLAQLKTERRALMALIATLNAATPAAWTGHRPLHRTLDRRAEPLDALGS